MPRQKKYVTDRFYSLAADPRPSLEGHFDPHTADNLIAPRHRGKPLAGVRALPGDNVLC